MKGSSLFGSPKLHTTGINTSDKNWIQRDFRPTSSGIPFTPDAGMDGYGFRATGKITFPASGTYTMQMWFDDGARVQIDGKNIIDKWSNRTSGVAQISPVGTFVATAGKAYSFSLEYLHSNDSSGQGALELLDKRARNNQYPPAGRLGH